MKGWVMTVIAGLTISPIAIAGGLHMEEGDPRIRQLLDRARRVAETLPAGSSSDAAKFNIIQRIATMQAEAGDIGGARLTAGDLPEAASTRRRDGPIAGWRRDPVAVGRKIKCLAAIAVAQAKGGDRDGSRATFREALDFLTDGPATGEDVIRLAEIVEAQAKAGDREEASETARRAIEIAEGLPVSVTRWDRQFGYNRSHALYRVAFALGSEGGGQADRATRLASDSARAIEEEGHRDQTIARIAIERVREGDAVGALGFVESAPQFADPTRRGIKEDLLKLIAVTRAQAGDAKGARETAARIGTASTMLAAVTDIAQIQAESGDWAGARTSLDSVRVVAQGHRVDLKGLILLSRLARAEAETGRRDRSIEIARQVIDAFWMLGFDPDSQGFILGMVAPALGKSGDRAGADAALRTAKDFADGDPSPTLKSLRLVEIARARIAIGEVNEAVAIFASLSGSGIEVRAGLAGEIVAAYAKLGKLPDAMLALEWVPDCPEKPQRVADIAERIALSKASSGDEAWAIQWAEQQPIPLARARALLGAARGIEIRKAAAAP